jgi:hypothetical protein
MVEPPHDDVSDDPPADATTSPDDTNEERAIAQKHLELAGGEPASIAAGLIPAR